MTHFRWVAGGGLPGSRCPSYSRPPQAGQLLGSLSMFLELGVEGILPLPNLGKGKEARDGKSRGG